MKKIANSKVRIFLKEIVDIKNGCMYKKIFESGEIKDYCFHETKRAVISRWESEQKEIANGVITRRRCYETLEDELIEWYKWYKRK